MNENIGRLKSPYVFLISKFFSSINDSLNASVLPIIVYVVGGIVISYYGIYVTKDEWSYNIASIGGALKGYSIYSSLKLYFHGYKSNNKESIK